MSDEPNAVHTLVDMIAAKIDEVTKNVEPPRDAEAAEVAEMLKAHPTVGLFGDALEHGPRTANSYEWLADDSDDP